jgi:hypothetical protein
MRFAPNTKLIFYCPFAKDGWRQICHIGFGLTSERVVTGSDSHSKTYFPSFSNNSGLAPLFHDGYTTAGARECDDAGARSIFALRSKRGRPAFARLARRMGALFEKRGAQLQAFRADCANASDKM